MTQTFLSNVRKMFVYSARTSRRRTTRRQHSTPPHPTPHPPRAHTHTHIKQSSLICSVTLRRQTLCTSFPVLHYTRRLSTYGTAIHHTDSCHPIDQNNDTPRRHTFIHTMDLNLERSKQVTTKFHLVWCAESVSGVVVCANACVTMRRFGCDTTTF